MQSKVKKINFNGQDIYVGIDVHLKNWVVTIIGSNIIYKT
ncbi:MAG TPA: IS110 family transposase, partial [Bacteroidetes bacterium]|nr:IS110 family transposase [Bacteroidota bacterium]